MRHKATVNAERRTLTRSDSKDSKNGNAVEEVCIFHLLSLLLFPEGSLDVFGDFRISCFEPADSLFRTVAIQGLHGSAKPLW